MALPKKAKREAQNKLRTFCEERIPERVRDELRLDFDFWGDNVNLIEKRIHWRNKEEWIDIRVAQFRYDPDTEKWSLLWLDRNDQLHPYQRLWGKVKSHLQQVDNLELFLHYWFRERARMTSHLLDKLQIEASEFSLRLSLFLVVWIKLFIRNNC